jgi:hypothetical protein
MFQLTNGEYPYMQRMALLSMRHRDMILRSRRKTETQDFMRLGDLSGRRSIKHYRWFKEYAAQLYEYWEDANPNPDNAAPYINPNKIDPKNGQNLFDFGRDSKTYWVKGLTPFHWRVQTGYTFKKTDDFAGPAPASTMTITRWLYS